MIANYHTHTWRCLHASGTEREYVEAAIRGGLSILGFSDHAPTPYEGDYKAGFKMTMDQLEDYADTVLALKREYAGDIEIRLGLEAEYYPKYWEPFLEACRTCQIEYLLLGQHILGDGIDEPYCGYPSGSEEDLARYVEQTTEAMDTGLFTYFAHPDLFFFTGGQEFYKRQMRILCERTAEHHIPLEINMLGIETNRNYPNPIFWKIAGETGNTAIIGSDAHSAENVVNPEAFRKAQEIARENGLPVIDTVPITNLNGK